jgi:2-hydroxychromene-2-carboxylate isomerase
MPILQYYMTPASPWTYFGHSRFTDLAARHGATIQLRPVDYGKVFPQSGGLPLPKRAPQRQAYRLVELQRWSRHLDIPLNVHPKHFPVPPNDAAQRIIAADLAEGTGPAMALAFAVMRAVWVEDRDIADPDTLAAIVAACGLDAARLAARADEARDAYDRYTDEAIEKQVFGAPWYVLDGEPFWGQDRLEFLARALEGRTAR